MQSKLYKEIHKLVIGFLVFVAILNTFFEVSYGATNVMDEVKQIIETNSISNINGNSSNPSSIESMVKSLNDPYAEYISVGQYKNYMDNLNDRYVGIGAYINTAPDGVEIVSIMDDSPSLAAGLKEGDIITIADGKILSGLPLGIASSYIKGEEGSVAKLHIKRGWSFFSCDVVRKRVTVPTVIANMLDGHIGYIKITSFTETTSNDFKKSIKKIKAENPDDYIIDLRDNGGGFLSSAVEIAGCFIEALKPVVIVKDRNNQEEEYMSLGSTDVVDKPVIFLVNKNTASASEVLTAAVKDYKKALVVGTNTYGKGTVQGIFALSDGSAVKMTIQSFYSPNGSPIDKKGIQPDIDVKGADALTAARLMLGKGNSDGDKTRFVKLKIGNREFEIDLKAASHFLNWSTFRAIIESAGQNGSEVYIGNSEGLVKANEDVLNEIVKIFYPGYIDLGVLSNVPTDKVFKITFNSEIDSKSISEKNLEIINSRSGERIPFDVEPLDGFRIKVRPQATLSIGQTYHLVIHSTVMGKDGGSLRQGTYTKVTVK